MRRFVPLTVLMLLVCGCQDRSSKPAATPATYAGSAACEECHQKLYDEWKGSHHAGAQRLLADTLDRQAFEPRREIHHATQTSTAEIKDGKLVLTTMGRDGRPQPFTPAEALGVYPLWQYLIPADGGRFQLTELAFDPDKKEWFDVYNDEDRKAHEWGHWSNRGMNWNSMCATCHTTTFQKNYDPAKDAYASKYLERGIGCEQCHGPMKEHADWQKQHGNRKMPPLPEQDLAAFNADPRQASEVRKRITEDPTLKTTDWPTYFSACAACHSRRADLTGTFQPGERYFDHYDLVLPNLSDTFYPDGQIRDEDFEISAFTTSYMHGSGIRCMDCHNPHTGKRKLEGDALCMRCHIKPVTTKVAIDAAHSHHPAGKGGSLCTDCHMPQTVYMARHWRHDHGMTIPDPLLTKEHDIPNACTRCHNDKSVDWSQQYVEQWYGKRMERPTRTRAQLLARIKKADLSAVPDLLRVLHEEKSPTWRAICAKFLTAAVALPGSEQREKVVSELLNVMNDESPVSQAAAIETLDAFAATGLPDSLAKTVSERISKALTSSSRLVRVKAAWALRRQLPDNSPARQELIASMNYSQDQPTGAFQWAQFLVDSHRPGEALSWYEKAIGWDPYTAAFRHEYATTLDALQRPEEALAQAAKAVELEPDQAMHRYAMGLLYGELGRLPEARDALKAAVQRDARQPRYWYNLGSIEAKLSEWDAALEAITKAEQLENGLIDYPLARAQILIAMARYDQARAALDRVFKLDPNSQPGREVFAQLEAARSGPQPQGAAQ